MNTQGCPEGVFTDEILVFPGFVKTCQASIAGWLSLAICLNAIRLALTVPMVWDRRRKLASKKQSQTAHRIPVFLITHVTTALLQTLFIVLTSLNIANTRNGGSPFLFGLYCTGICIGHGIMARSVINLGKKIVPLSEKRLGKQQSLDNLSKSDVVLKVLGMCATVAVLLMSVCFTIGLAMGGNQAWTFQAGLGSTVGYEAAASIAMVHQFQRCLNAISKLKMSTASSSDTTGMETHQANSNGLVVAMSSSSLHMMSSAQPNQQSGNSGALRTAIRTMRIQQLLTLMAGLCMSSLTLVVAAFVILFEYWVLCLTFFLLDIIFQTGLTFAAIFAGRKRNRQRQAPTKDYDNANTLKTTNQPNNVETAGSYVASSNAPVVTHIG